MRSHQTTYNLENKHNASLIQLNMLFAHKTSKTFNMLNTCINTSCHVHSILTQGQRAHLIPQSHSTLTFSSRKAIWDWLFRVMSMVYHPDHFYLRHNGIYPTFLHHTQGPLTSYNLTKMHYPTQPSCLFRQYQHFSMLITTYSTNNRLKNHQRSHFINLSHISTTNIICSTSQKHHITYHNTIFQHA